MRESTEVHICRELFLDLLTCLGDTGSEGLDPRPEITEGVEGVEVFHELAEEESKKWNSKYEKYN